MDQFLEDIPDVIHVEKGDCVGIVLNLRAPNDRHICWTLICEDDGNWFATTEGCSTYWLPDLEEGLNRTKTWLSNNATRDEWGWLAPAGASR